MNYLFLKNVVDMAVEHFNCPQCTSRVSAGHVSILTVDPKGVMASIHCPQCHHEASLRAEMNVVAAEQVHSTLQALRDSAQVLSLEQGINSIQDEDIVSLRKTLKKVSTIDDLLK